MRDDHKTVSDSSYTTDKEVNFNNTGTYGLNGDFAEPGSALAQKDSDEVCGWVEELRDEPYLVCPAAEANRRMAEVRNAWRRLLARLRKAGATECEIRTFVRFFGLGAWTGSGPMTREAIAKADCCSASAVGQRLKNLEGKLTLAFPGFPGFPTDWYTDDCAGR